MLSWSQVLAHQERYEDLYTEAEGNRLTRQALAVSRKRGRIHHRALARLGRRLVILGCRLQVGEANPSWLGVDVLVGNTENTLACGDC